MSGRISVGGLVSGIDFNSIVTQLIQIERESRIGPIQKAIQRNDARLTKLQDFNGLIGAVRSAAQKLNSVSGARPRTATSSNTNLIRVSSVGSDAIPGAYPVTQVRRLAQSEMLASQETLGGGAIDNSSFSFAVRSNGITRTVTTTDFSSVSASKQLGQLATDINQDAGDVVNAFVVNAETAFARLIIQSKATGSSLTGGDVLDGSEGVLGDISFSAGPGAALTTLQGLEFVSLGFGGTAFTRDRDEVNNIQDNLDLSLSIGSVSFAFDKNTVSTMVPGVALDFLSTFASGTVTLTVNNDTATLQSNVQSLVDAFNEMRRFVKDETTFDTKKNSAGILQSNAAVRLMHGAALNAFGLDIIGQPKDYRHGPDVGLTLDKEGFIVFDSSKLATRMSSDFTSTGEVFRGFKFTSDSFDPTTATAPIGAFTMSFKVKGITISVSGTAAGATNRDRLNSYRDEINADGRGILVAKVVDEPSGNIRLSINGDNMLIDNDLESLSAGATEVSLGLVSAATSVTAKNPSPAIGSYIEGILKDLLDGTVDAPGIIQSEIDQLESSNLYHEQRIDQQEAFIEGIETRMRIKFTTLESLLAKFQAQGDFLSQRLIGSGTK